MPNTSTTRSTAFALLTLIGCVGGLGSGLHALVHQFGGYAHCYWHAVQCRHEFFSPSGGEATGHAIGEAAGFTAHEAAGRGECPICTLVDRYHAPPVTPPTTCTAVLLHTAVIPVEPCLPHSEPRRAHRPRGPPRSV
ncbi:hypothetical protein PLANPX_2334 [Lacipirellula parvula]|uniref:Uncharacterized protein n=1 Tax=Lacipirellula parvula TaxID=2650471 RepID=A0A5K7XA19_9BACT|nr:hypothetical protein PLANPX_2334 [Lacipirellula parvula]